MATISHTHPATQEASHIPPELQIQVQSAADSLESYAPNLLLRAQTDLLTFSLWQLLASLSCDRRARRFYRVRLLHSESLGVE